MQNVDYEAICLNPLIMGIWQDLPDKLKVKSLPVCCTDYTEMKYSLLDYMKSESAK